MNRTVVVLGAGVGGLSVVDSLRQHLPDSDRIVLVDKQDEQFLGLSLLWVMRGWREPQEITVHPSIVQERGVEFVKAEVESIALPERRVKTRGSGELAYDALVIALGAALDSALIPGLEEVLRVGPAGEYYTLDGAVQLRERLATFEKGRVCVLISRLPFKCPAAPYEGALLLADLFSERGTRDAVQIDVFTPEGLPMPVAGPKVGGALVDILQEHQIGFHPKTEVEKVDPQLREVVFKSGAREHYDFLLVIPPHRPPAPVAAARLGEQGWVPVDPRTLRTKAEGVWALGDVAALPLRNGLFLPKAAVFAEGEAKVVAHDIARHFGYEAPEPWFNGEGACWIEVGHGAAASGGGNFLADPGPVVELRPPSASQHLEKEEQERAWIHSWSRTPI